MITDKTRPFTARMDEIRRLAQEIKRALPNRRSKLIVVHGGGSFPHTPAVQHRVHEGAKNGDFGGFVLVQQAAAELNKIVGDEFVAAGLDVFRVQPSAGALAKRSRITQWNADVFKKALDRGLLPVTYGDVALDLAQGCCILSSEEIIRYLSTKLAVDRVILGSDVGGLFTQDPKTGPEAERVPLITPRNFRQFMKYAQGSAGIDATGGMELKIRLLLEVVKRNRNVECEIVNISHTGVLESVLLGKRGMGTVIRGS